MACENRHLNWVRLVETKIANRTLSGTYLLPSSLCKDRLLVRSSRSLHLRYLRRAGSCIHRSKWRCVPILRLGTLPFGRFSSIPCQLAIRNKRWVSKIFKECWVPAQIWKLIFSVSSIFILRVKIEDQHLVIRGDKKYHHRSKALLRFWKRHLPFCNKRRYIQNL